LVLDNAGKGEHDRRVNTHRALCRHARWLPAALALAATAALALAAVCGPVEQQAADATATATASETVLTTDTATADAATPEAPSIQYGTPTPAPTVAFPTASAGDAMTIGGSAWVDARPVSGEIVALIGGHVCGRGQSGRLTPGDTPVFVLTVRSALQEEGCGTPGAKVILAINGRAANQSFTFNPGLQQQLTLTAGAPFAQLNGEITGSQLADFAVIPYIDGIACGVDLGSPLLPNGRTPYFRVIVDSAELATGCGLPGTQVRLVLTSVGRPPVEIGALPWQEGALVIEPIDIPGEIPPQPR
jgi:hypothetical protein